MKRTERPACFPLPLRGDHLGHYRWQLTAPFEYTTESFESYRVPISFITDGKSIPKLAQAIIGGHWGGMGGYIATHHDYWYKTQQISRLKADKLFLEGLRRSGVSWLKRQTMYRFVRAVSWVAWNKYNPGNKNRNPAKIYKLRRR